MYRVCFNLISSCLDVSHQSFWTEGVGGGFVTAPVRVREDKDSLFESETERTQRFWARSKQPFRVVIADHLGGDENVYDGDILVIDAVLDGEVQEVPRPITAVKVLAFATCEVPHSPGRVSRQKTVVEEVV